MPTRNVVLTDHQDGIIGDLVASGRYQNASEVLRAGLRLLEQHEAEDAARLDALRRAVAEGVADLEAGRFETLAGAADVDAYLDAIDCEPPSDSPAA
jgi:antitoxin ParD1/3/4